MNSRVNQQFPIIINIILIFILKMYYSNRYRKNVERHTIQCTRS